MTASPIIIVWSEEQFDPGDPLAPDVKTGEAIDVGDAFATHRIVMQIGTFTLGRWWYVAAPVGVVE